MTPDPLRYFRIEAAELVERLGQGALSIEKGEVPSGGVAALLRHAHTLKGAARVVKQIEIADQAHAIEDVLSPHRASTEALPRECATASGRSETDVDQARPFSWSTRSVFSQEKPPSLSGWRPKWP